MVRLTPRFLARLPTAGVVASEHDAVDGGACLLVEAQRQRLVEHPGELPAESEPCDPRGRVPDRVPVELVARASTRGDETVSVLVEDAGASGLPVELAGLGQTLEPRVEYGESDGLSVHRLRMCRDDGNLHAAADAIRPPS